MRLIRRTNVLLGAISLDLFAVLLGGAVALLPIFAKDVLEVGPTGSASCALRPLSAHSSRHCGLHGVPSNDAPARRSSSSSRFGASMVVFGLSRAMWLSMLALALGGALDMVSVVLRSTILPLVTPDEVRGRVNAVEMVFISASNELGAFESGVAAADRRGAGGRPRRCGRPSSSRVSGGGSFPSLARVDSLDDLRPVTVERLAEHPLSIETIRPGAPWLQTHRAPRDKLKGCGPVMVIEVEASPLPGHALTLAFPQPCSRHPDRGVDEPIGWSAGSGCLRRSACDT